MHREFKENIVHDINRRYKVKVPWIPGTQFSWIPGTQLSETNETQSRLRLKRVERKLKQDECLRKDYEKIIIDQVAAGIIEKAPDTPTEEQVFYMPHKPVVKQDAITMKTRMVFMPVPNHNLFQAVSMNVCTQALLYNPCYGTY